jgi:hypothetical protein
MWYFLELLTVLINDQIKKGLGKCFWLLEFTPNVERNGWSKVRDWLLTNIVYE